MPALDLLAGLTEPQRPNRRMQVAMLLRLLLDLLDEENEVTADQRPVEDGVLPPVIGERSIRVRPDVMPLP